MTKGPCTWSLILSYAFFHLFVYVKISSQNACYVCEEHKIETEFNFFYDGQKFQRECVYMIERTWRSISFLMCKNVGRKFRTRVQGL